MAEDLGVEYTEVRLFQLLLQDSGVVSAIRRARAAVSADTVDTVLSLWVSITGSHRRFKSYENHNINGVCAHGWRNVYDSHQRRELSQVL